MKKWLAIILMLPIFCFAASPTSAWEEVDDAPTGHMYRLSVPHGWLVYTYAGGMTSASTTFVPDENHEWTLNP